MGLACSCGVRSNPVSVATNIGFLFADGESRDGTLTFAVNVCVDRLELSTFSAIFADGTGFIPNRSFSFTATDITVVSCTPNPDGTCTVSIQGMGLVTGEVTPRLFTVTFVNRPSPSTDRMISFTIAGFGNNTILGDLAPDLTFFGCPTTP